MPRYLNDLLPLEYQTKIQKFFMFFMHATCFTHLILLHFITLIVQVMKLHIMHFSLTSPILVPNILLSTSLSNTLYPCLILM